MQDTGGTKVQGARSKIRYHSQPCTAQLTVAFSLSVGASAAGAGMAVCPVLKMDSLLQWVLDPCSQITSKK